MLARKSTIISANVYKKGKGITKSLCMYVYQNECLQTDPVAERYLSTPKTQPVTDKCGKNIGITTNNKPIDSNYDG